jgi:hypothetical protein
MTAEISDDGYANLGIGNKIATEWDYIEFQTSTGTKIIRIATSDARVTQSSVTSKKVVYAVALTGSDSDISGLVPVTFSKAVFKATNSDAAAVLGTDTFTDAPINTTADTLNVTVNAGIL